MTQPIPIAVVGAGRWGTHLIRNFATHPHFELVAVLDSQASHLTTLHQRLGLGAEVNLVTDWQALTQLPLEAVAIATPATTHYSLITAALQQGYHVLAEKPLTLRATESLTLCRLATQQQRQLVVDHTYLFHPAVQQGVQVVQSGSLGSLRYGYASRTHLGPIRQDVDALWDLAIHDISIFNTWLEEFPQQVSAQGRTWLQPDLSPAPQFVDGLADLVWVTLTYPSGFQAWLHLCWLNSDKQRRLSVVGSQGTLIFDELNAASMLTLHTGQLDAVSGQVTTFVPAQQSQRSVAVPPMEPLKQVCDHFWHCIQTGQNSSVSSGLTGANLVHILEALSQSLQQGGQPISLSPVNLATPD